MVWEEFLQFQGNLLLWREHKGGSASRGWVQAAARGHTAQGQGGWERERERPYTPWRRTRWGYGNRKDGGDTDRYVRVLVENDLKEVRRENRRGFEMLLGSDDVLFLPVRTWRGAGQICKQATATVTLLSLVVTVSEQVTTDWSVH